MESSLSLKVENVGKKFFQKWVFKNISFELQPVEQVAIVGANGSGKSTLLHLIAGQSLPTEGRVSYFQHSQKLNREKWYRHLSWASPAMDLYTEFSLGEHLALHFSFNTCLLKSFKDIIPLLNLEAHQDKPLRTFSSGMLQKVKIGQSLFTQSSLLLLDEPTSFMDEKNAKLMLELIQAYSKDRILVVASNMKREIELFDRHIQL